MREAAAELAVGGGQGRLGIEVDFAGQVGEGEEEVADLLRDPAAVAALQRFAQLADLLFDLVQDGGRIGPVETDAGRLLGQAVGGQEGGEGGGDAGEEGITCSTSSRPA